MLTIGFVSSSSPGRRGGGGARLLSVGNTEVRKSLRFVFAGKVDDVRKAALKSSPSRKRAAKTE